MAQLCKDQAAIRYNTQTQLVDVNHFEQFQASYELSGRTGKNERFICSFDPDWPVYASFDALNRPRLA